MPEKNRVGSKIRQIREAQELTIAQLAERSRSTERLIEQLEAGELVPSLTPLMQIARALGVRLGTFLDDEPQSGAVVVRSGCSDNVVRFSGKAPEADSGGTLEFSSLASHKKDRHMEPFLITVHPRPQQHAPLSSHEGEEFIYVLSGTVEVCYGQERHTLEAGDSIYYDSIVPHDLHACGETSAAILAVVYAPF